MVIHDRNLRVAKLVPFSARNAEEQELILVAAGRLRLPKGQLNIKKLLKIPTGKVTANRAIEAVLADRNAEIAGKPALNLAQRRRSGVCENHRIPQPGY